MASTLLLFFFWATNLIIFNLKIEGVVNEITYFDCKITVKQITMLVEGYEHEPLLSYSLKIPSTMILSTLIYKLFLTEFLKTFLFNSILFTLPPVWYSTLSSCIIRELDRGFTSFITITNDSEAYDKSVTSLKNSSKFQKSHCSFSGRTLKFSNPKLNYLRISINIHDLV